MNEAERNAMCHGKFPQSLMKTVINGAKLTTDCIIQYGGANFTFNINKAIELGLLIKEE